MRVAVAMTPRRIALAALLALGLAAGADAQVIGESSSRLRAGRFDVTLRFTDERMRQLESQIRPLLTATLERYTALFGGMPRGSDGAPVTSLVVRFAPAALGGAQVEAGMLNILVSRQSMFGFYDWRLAMLHEAFHLWSGETFRNAGAGEQWFHEGAAEFYAMQTLARLDVVDDVTAVRNAATIAGFYVTARDQHRLSLVEAGQQQALHEGLVRHGGWAAALLLDHMIRARSANARSMDDVMRWMYATFDASSRRYTTLDLARGVQVATGQDMTEFFARFVLGRLPLPLSASVDLGELSRSLISRRSGFADVPAPDSLLMHSLGIAGQRR